MLHSVNSFRAAILNSAVLDHWATLHEWIGTRLPPALVRAWRMDPRELVIALDPTSDKATVTDAGLAAPEYFRQTASRFGPLLSATIRVPVQRCLLRDLTLPRAAATRIGSILDIDMERTTPFRSKDVYSGWSIIDPGHTGLTLAVRQYIVKRHVLDRIVSEVAAAGIPLKSIAVVDALGRELDVDLLRPAERRRARITVWLARAAIAGAIASALGSACYVTLAIQNLQSALVLADSDIQQVTTRVQSLRRTQNEAATSAALMLQPRQMKIERTSALALWNELSQRLPDSTWITEFRVDDGNVQIDGQSTNASELVSLLNASKQFTNVAFASPVTRDPQRSVERFQIKFQINTGRLNSGRITPEASK